MGRIRQRGTVPLPLGDSGSGERRSSPGERVSFQIPGKPSAHFQGADVSQSSVATTQDNVAKEESRRSTRIDRSVPLIVLGQNRIGEPIVERTVSTSVNLHGCRYPSRHDYGVGTWVTLQVVGLNVEPKPPAIRARVRSIHPSQNTRELQQVGVELEKPGNVWGVVTPPQDWLSFGEIATFAPQSSAVAGSEPETPPIETEAAEADELREPAEPP